MYAIVEIAGQQFKVEKEQQLYVHRLQGREGDQVEFGKVIMVDDGEKISLGMPAVEGGKVTAKILRHLKDEKVIVFKKKRRKGYRVKNGHRQMLSQIVIEKIEAKGFSEPKEKKETAKPAAKKEAGVSVSTESPAAGAPEAKKAKAPKKASEKRSSNKGE